MSTRPSSTTTTLRGIPSLNLLNAGDFQEEIDPFVLILLINCSFLLPFVLIFKLFYLLLLEFNITKQYPDYV